MSVAGSVPGSNPASKPAASLSKGAAPGSQAPSGSASVTGSASPSAAHPSVAHPSVAHVSAARPSASAAKASASKASKVAAASKSQASKSLRASAKASKASASKASKSVLNKASASKDGSKKDASASIKDVLSQVNSELNESGNIGLIVAGVAIVAVILVVGHWYITNSWIPCKYSTEDGPDQGADITGIKVQTEAEIAAAAANKKKEAEALAIKEREALRLQEEAERKAIETAATADAARQQAEAARLAAENDPAAREQAEQARREAEATAAAARVAAEAEAEQQRQLDAIQAKKNQIHMDVHKCVEVLAKVVKKFEDLTQDDFDALKKKNGTRKGSRFFSSKSASKNPQSNTIREFIHAQLLDKETAEELAKALYEGILAVFRAVVQHLKPFINLQNPNLRKQKQMKLFLDNCQDGKDIIGTIFATARDNAAYKATFKQTQTIGEFLDSNADGLDETCIAGALALSSIQANYFAWRYQQGSWYNPEMSYYKSFWSGAQLVFGGLNDEEYKVLQILKAIVYTNGSSSPVKPTKGKALNPYTYWAFDYVKEGDDRPQAFTFDQEKDLAEQYKKVATVSLGVEAFDDVPEDLNFTTYKNIYQPAMNSYIDTKKGNGPSAAFFRQAAAAEDEKRDPVMTLRKALDVAHLISSGLIRSIFTHMRNHESDRLEKAFLALEAAAATP